MAAWLILRVKIPHTMRKNTQKIEVRLPLMSRSGSKRPTGQEITDLYNLRPQYSHGISDRLEICGEGRRYDGTSGFLPVGRTDYGGHRCLLSARGRDIALTDTSQSEAKTTVYADMLPGEVYCSMPTASDETLLMTQGGAVRLSTAKGVEIKGAGADYPPVSLHATEDVRVSVNVGSRELSRVYGGGERLDRRDATDVYSDLSEAYRTLCRLASGAGAMIQPALMRYRLLDAQGCVLYTSAPVLAAHPTGSQCASPKGLYSDDRRTLGCYTLEAATWKPEATIYPGSESAAAEVRACEVYMTPLFHPYSANTSLPPLSTGRAASQNTPFVNVSLPGGEYGLGDEFSGGCRRNIMQAIAHIDELEHRVAVIPNPFGDTLRRVSIDASASPNPQTDSTAIALVFDKPVRRMPLAETLLSQRHPFTARAAASDAATAVWGNLSIGRSKPYSLATHGAGDSDESWSAEVQVVFADGSGVTRTESYYAGAPMQLSPVLVYPSPDAVEMNLKLSRGGEEWHGGYSLTPDPSGRFSVYVGGACALAFEKGSSALRTVSPREDAFADMLAFAPASNPLAVDATAKAGGEVKCLGVKSVSDQSWEFGRSRFYCAGAGGVCSIGAGSGRSKLSVKLLSRREVSDAGHFRALASGEAFFVSGDAIYNIDTRGKVSFFDSYPDVKALLADEDRGELLACDDSGVARVYCASYDRRYYRRDTDAVGGFVQCAGEAFAQSDKGIIALFDELARNPRNVRMEATVSTDKPIRVTSLGVDMESTGSTVRYSAEGCDISGRRCFPIKTVTISGLVKSAIHVAAVSRPVRQVRLSFDGIAGQGLCIDSFSIETEA